MSNQNNTPIPTATQTPLDFWTGPGQLNLLQNTFGITLVFQSDTTPPDDSLPLIRAHFTNTQPELIHWTQFPGAPFWRSQNLNPKTLQSLQTQTTDSHWHEVFLKT